MEKNDTAPKKTRGATFVIGLILGMILGGAGMRWVPGWLTAYLPASLGGGRTIAGEVLNKEKQSQELLLKVKTEHGVLLATFTSDAGEIDLLVDAGDRLALRVDEYSPFLQDPVIARVEKPPQTAGGGSGTAPGPAPSARTVYRRAMEEKLQKWESDIAALRERLDKATPELKKEYEKQIADLDIKLEVARRKLLEFRAASDAGWRDMRRGMDDAWKNLREAIDKASERFQSSKDQEPPGKTSE